jgi:ribonucleoside-triphosphate reductase
VGLNKACCNLLGSDITSEKGQLFGLRVLEYMRERLDAEQFPGIRSANTEGGKPFYTNSSQLPVHYSDDPFEVLDLQDEL